MSNALRAVGVGMALVVAFALAFSIYVAVRESQCFASYCHLLPGHERFESSRWKSSLAVELQTEVRLRMVDDLLFNTKHLAGLSRDQVISLLGEPPKTGYFSEYELVYWLGPERSFIRIDSEWLAVKFNAQGVVERAALVRD